MYVRGDLEGMVHGSKILQKYLTKLNNYTIYK